MTARVLVVDDIPANAKLLEARLAAEYFDVVTARNGNEALAACRTNGCDIVLLDVMMPDMDGFEVCRHLKSDPETQHIPVVMVTALDQPCDRVAGLEAGADDFLTKPVSAHALLARVRSLTRLKMMTDELRMRALTSREIGLPAGREAVAETGRNGRILLVDDNADTRDRIAATLGAEHKVEIESDPNRALLRTAEGDYELAIVSLLLRDFDGLRLCGQLRSLERTRGLPILALCQPNDDAKLMRGLDIGINDYLMRPIDRNELLARVRTQIRRKRYTDRLRDNVQSSIEAAFIDSLTGLHNRRYMESHLARLVEQAAGGNRPLSVLMLDIDYFKSINDRLGHDAGDEVLREVAARLRQSVRGVDLVCRQGGEEFLVMMPETDMAVAAMIAERLRRSIAMEPFDIEGKYGPRALNATISIGAASFDAAEDAANLLRRADQALYRAKRDGRNRVAAAA